MTPLTEREPPTAIYVDFDSIGNKIDRPAILGMLVADDTGDRFQQFVLDDVLRDAFVARKRACVNSTPEKAVMTIVEEEADRSRGSAGRRQALWRSQRKASRS